MPEPKRKPIKDHNGIELRQIARADRHSRSGEAGAELRRRRANLRAAVIPTWEIAERGPEYLAWGVV